MRSLPYPRIGPDYGRPGGTVGETVMSRALVGVLVAGPPDCSRIEVPAARAMRSAAAAAPPSSSRPVATVGRAA
jgi:hypothetical protein